MVCFTDERKIIFIHIPKTGGMTIERILIDNYGFKNFTFQNGPYEMLRKEEGKEGFFKYILKYSEEAKKYDLASFRKFTFVRNPYSRANSGIRYLTEFSEHYPDNINDFIELCKERTFWYVHFILPQYKVLENLDSNINMDYIGRFEHFNEDLERILFDEFHFERKDLSSYHIHKSDPKIIEYDQEIVKKIVRILHEEDFKKFGYQIKD